MASFRINRVYTRTGDDGSTGLLDGSRVSKADMRVQAYGDVDETCTALGYARCLLKPDFPEIAEELCSIQQELFDIGAELSAPSLDNIQEKLLVCQGDISRLEHLCDQYVQDLKPLESFVLPGTDLPSSALHMARVIARRTERSVLDLMQDRAGSVRPEVVQYLNRLSDLLFVYSRVVEQRSTEEVLYWVKPEERRK
jgi:cob(I)alamin adenosyltransferase